MNQWIAAGIGFVVGIAATVATIGLIAVFKAPDWWGKK